MPRSSKVVKVVAPNSTSGNKVGSLVARSAGSIRRLKVGVFGQPGEGLTQETFPIVRKPSYRKAGIRTLIKKNIADGLTGPEADNYTRTSGVITGDRGGFKGGVKVMLQKPLTPASISGSGNGARRVITPPDPTNRGGVRNPYSPNKRAGRSSKGSNRRVG